jgi:hypothetical protein
MANAPPVRATLPFTATVPAEIVKVPALRTSLALPPPAGPTRTFPPSTVREPPPIVSPAEHASDPVAAMVSEDPAGIVSMEAVTAWAIVTVDPLGGTVPPQVAPTP